MGKIRVKTLGDEAFEKEQAVDAKKRREGKKALRQAQDKTKKAQVKGVGLKGGQRITAMEGVELTETDSANQTESTEEGKESKKKRKIKERVRSKRYLALQTFVDKTKSYPLDKAIELVKKTSNTRFDATVETHININPTILTADKKTLSGSVTLPHGTGKKRVIAIADEALIEKVAKGMIEFDILVAHPSLMPKLAKVARILGPKGLMPNPKTGTISPTPEKRAKELEGGELNWKTQADQPLIHQAIGKASFTSTKLIENSKALIKSIGANKIAKLTLSSSMGPGIRVDISTL